LLASLGHPCKFQRVSHLGSVTARHSSSGRVAAALNRGRHLRSAGRPSRWALAHISSCVILKCFIIKMQLNIAVKPFINVFACVRDCVCYFMSTASCPATDASTIVTPLKTTRLRPLGPQIRVNDGQRRGGVLWVFLAAGRWQTSPSRRCVPSAFRVAGRCCWRATHVIEQAGSAHDRPGQADRYSHGTPRDASPIGNRHPPPVLSSRQLPGAAAARDTRTLASDAHRELCYG